jgi:hypothetical protein
MSMRMKLLALTVLVSLVSVGIYYRVLQVACRWFNLAD